MSNEDLLKIINDAANMIHNKNLRGYANYMIVSARAAEMIDNLDIKRLRKKKLLEILKKADE